MIKLRVYKAPWAINFHL